MNHDGALVEISCETHIEKSVRLHSSEKTFRTHANKNTLILNDLIYRQNCLNLPVLSVNRPIYLLILHKLM